MTDDELEVSRDDTGRSERCVRSLLGTAAFVAVVSVGLAAIAPRSAPAQNNRGASQTVGDAPGEKSGTVEYHEVHEGDTLWDLSGRYYGDPYRWPRMWSYNPHITNPHWIYPGDIVYLEEARERQRRADRGGGEGGRDEGDDGVKEGLRLVTGGFIVREEPEFVGRIVASPKEARLLGQYDSCWVGFGDEGYTDRERDQMKKKNIRDLGDPGDVSEKDRFAIVEDQGELEDDDGNVIGHKYLVLGSLVVTKRNEEKLDTAHIDQSWREIERGAYLLPYERQLRVVDHVEADDDQVASIIDSVRGKFDFGQFDFVFIDKGAADGIRIGNRLYAYQRRAGLPGRWTKGARNNQYPPNEIPWRRVGHVRVVDVTENYATAIVTQSDRELQRGDRLEMYQGN